MIEIETRRSKCLVCYGELVWCKSCGTYHHNGDTDHRDRRGFNPIGDPDENFYRSKK